jgi:phenylacetic acid degradation operon negative regulatory protein
MSNVADSDSWTPVRRAEVAPSARSLLLTLLGEFVLPDGGTAWTRTLLHALRLLGVEEGASRQALARSSTRGLLVAERIGRRTRWSLTEKARAILTEGAARIYGFPGDRTDWDGQWLLVLTTIPEHNRHLRARLRTLMAWAGFGSLGAGVWVCPWADREPRVQSIVSELALAGSTLSWLGRPGGLGGVIGRVTEVWDLEKIAAEYDAFVSAVGAEEPRSPEGALTALIRLVHDWRHFPATDPGLPAALLPEFWPATGAAELFRAKRAEWSPAAWTYWREMSDDTARLPA